MPTKIADITNPIHDTMYKDWAEYRLVSSGGKSFLKEYLIKRVKESQTAFNLRTKITFIPTYAKSALQQIQNSIRQRLPAVNRKGGSQKYLDSIKGLGQGVDKNGASLNRFLGDQVLPELTTMGTVGIYVDAPAPNNKHTLADDISKIPYLYIYKVEDIRAWANDPNDPSKFTKLLLRDTVPKIDDEFGLIIEDEYQYRLYELTDDGVDVTFFNGESKKGETVALKLKEIPFILLNIGESILTDVASYQISLLNLGSANMKYAWEGNITFLAEMYDPNSPEQYFKSVESNPDTTGADDDLVKNPDKRFVGVDRGMRVPVGVDFPQYVSPDIAPLKISMELFDNLKLQIIELINQNLKSVKSAASSVESKNFDSHKEEDGLKAIGDELEYGDNRIAYFWAMYEGNSALKSEVSYPQSYEHKTYTEKLMDADSLIKTLIKIPSNTARRIIMKKVASILLSDSASTVEMDKIVKEINDAKSMFSDPLELYKLVDVSIVSPETASIQLGYPPGEAKKAEEARIKRAKEIALAQAQSTEGAKGNTDLAISPGGEARAQKTQSKLEGNTTVKTGPEV